MNGMMRSGTTEGNGYVWTDGVITVFEDTSEGVSQFYAWIGAFEDHDRADKTDTFPTLGEAVAALDA